MPRDMDLVRLILLRVEELHIPSGSFLPVGAWTPAMTLEGYSSDEVDTNLRLAVDGKLLDVNGAFGMDAKIRLAGLSWEGAEFLDKVREPENWAAAKGIAAKVGSFSIDVLKAAASSVIEAKLKLLIGS